MAEQDFEQLLGTLKQINSEMATLVEKIAKAKQEMSTMTNPADRMAAGRQIGGYQSALARKGQQASALSSGALNEISTSRALSASVSDADAERRLNLLTLGVSMTNSEIMAKGRATAQRVLALQKDILVEAQRELRNTPAEPTDPRFAGAKRTISTPQEVLTDRERLIRGSSSGNLRNRTLLETTDFSDDSPAQARKKEEAKLLESLKNRIRSEERYASVLQQLEKQNFSVDNLVYGRTKGTAGIQELRFRKNDGSGVQQQLDLFNNPSGRTTAGISNQFRTFGQGVVRDIGELTKWSLALAAVYGPMQKLGELTQEMIQNQTKLAEATIVVSSSLLDQSKIFDISAESANKSGEAISGVIDAFTLAYRATGGTGDEVTRLATAQKLLNDSLVLSKLSTLDQATAIDTLGAAVRQTGGDFNGTGTLLDKWVRVTKVANVDLATLATGFATVGDAAENVGLKVDELNGILAVLAESTNQSGQEVANTSRAIISGFQSQQGIQALEALGIATKDTIGNMRSLRDVMTEVASLREKGIINDTQFANLTLAIGGGTRRQAAVATFIENYSRAMQVAKESSRANGDAQAALAKQLDTVQTSLTKLANSFTTLAQTLGTEGGFLSIIQGSVEGLTALVKVFDGLIGLLGKATPAMAAFVAATLVLKQQGRGSVQEAILGYGQGLIGETSPELARLNAIGAGGIAPAPARNQGFKNFMGTNVLGSNISSAVFQGLGLAALPAIMNATNYKNGTDRWGGTKATADLVGGVVGGIVGSLTGPQGTLIGAAIGTAISEAFVNSTIARKTDLFAYNTSPTLGNKTTAFATQEDRDKALQEATAGLYKSIGGGNEGLGKFLTTGQEKNTKTLVDGLNEAIKNRDEKTFNRILNQTNVNSNINAKKILEGAGLSEGFLKNAFASGQQIQASPEYAAYLRASPEAQKAYDAVLASIKAVDDAKGGVNTPFTQQTQANQKLYGDIISGISTQSKKDLAGQRLAGDVTGAEYARRSTALTGFDSKSLQYYTAFGKEFEKMNGDINSATDAFNAFNTVIVTGAQDSVPELTAMVGQIEDLTNALNDPTLQQNPEQMNALLKGLGVDNIDEAKKKLQEYKDTAASIITDVYRNVQLQNVKVPQIEGQINKPLTSNENVLVEQRTKQLQDSFYQGFLKIPDAMYEAMKKSWEDFAVAIQDSGDTFYKSVTETDQQFRQAALQQLQEEGKIKSQKENPFNIQQLDITSGQGANLQGTINYFSKYLSTNFPQYKQNPEDVGVIFSDYVTSVLHGDNLAIKLALDKANELNQKQLDGMYNIPEGATFWVPLQAAYYRPKNEGGAGSMPTLDSTAVDGNTSATAENTRALEQLSSVMSNADRLKLEYQKDNRTNLTGQDPAKRVEAEYGKERGITQYAPGGLANPLPRGYHPVGYSGDPGYSRSTNQEGTSFVQQLTESLKNFFMGMTQLSTESTRGYHGAGSTYPGSTGARDMSNVAPQQVQARLDLRFDNSVQLLVDGRVLASVITPYLASDLVKLEASQGTITKRYVI